MDPNEDTRAKHMHTSGCSAAQIKTFKDPLHIAEEGKETCWTVTNFADPSQVLGYKPASSAESLVQPIAVIGSGHEWSE